MHKRWILLLLIVSLSFYCFACGKESFSNAETNVQEQDLQEETVSDTTSAPSEKYRSETEENKTENWTVKVAQQVLALAIWHGMKQIIHIIFWKKTRLTR